MKRRLLQGDAAPADLRPAMLSVWIALLLLLLPMLLVTSSPQKLAGIGLSVAGAGELPPHAGAVAAVSVAVGGDGAARVTAQVRRTDVGAGVGDTAERAVDVPGADGRVDLRALQAALTEIHRLDPSLTRITVTPADAAPVREIVALLDAVRSSGGRPLYPDVVLAQPEAP